MLLDSAAASLVTTGEEQCLRSLSGRPELCHCSSKLTSIMAFTLTSKNALALRTLATVILCLAVSIPATADAGEITVAAASDLTFAFKDVASRFETQTGSSVKLSYGSSGNFFSQIQNGAPFDLFFSADIEYPRKLEAAGFTEPGSIYAYATGKIVLWVPNASKLDLSRGLSVLLDPGIRKIAIANPQHA